MWRLQHALREIEAARAYTLRLLDNVPAARWFEISPGGVTHVAWQAGHLAMAQYRLLLERIRGVQPGDDDLISQDFLRLFGKDSQPAADAVRYPPVDEIRAVMDRVHRRSLAELAERDEASLAAPPLRPHRLFDTKMGSLCWCARHEMLHAGQIGLIRRHLGLASLW